MAVEFSHMLPEMSSPRSPLTISAEVLFRVSHAIRPLLYVRKTMAEAMAIISSAQRMAIPTIWLRRIACHSLNAFNRCFTGFNALPVNVGYPPRPGFHAVCRQYPARSTRCVVVVFYHAALRTVNGRQRHRKPPATDAAVVSRTFPHGKSAGKGRGSPRPQTVDKPQSTV